MKVRKYKRKKNRKPFYKRKFFWFSFLGVVLFLGLIYFFLFSPIFEIKQIKAQGCDFLDCSQLEKIVESQRRILFFTTNNIFLFNRKEAEAKLAKSFLPIKEVVIKRKLPNKLLLEVVERKPKAQVCFEDSCFMIDKTGFAFRKSEDASELLSICVDRDISLGSNLLSTEILNIILEIEQNLNDKTILKTKCYYILEDKIKVTLKDYNFSLYFSKEKDVALQVSDLELLLKNKFPEEQFGDLDYIDLRFDKIFLK